jgi:hypothetical protein
MPTWDSLASYGRELAGLEDDLTGPERQKITHQMGKRAQQIAAKQAASDLGGDRAFSGWTRAAPIPRNTAVRNGNEGASILTPFKRSAGPWTVAEHGRNSALGPRLTGPRLTKRGKVSRARVRRYNGRTRGKGTATEAVKVMEKELPKIADKGVKAVTRKRFDVT